jgi:glycosyltransferase involved in cell wall biosynthesis
VLAEPPARLRRRLGAQAWEQLALPVQAARRRAALVFSPANLAPLAWPRNVLVMHDAAVLRAPAAYSRAYRAWHGRLGIAGARGALAVITVSEFSRRELTELAGLDPARLVVIPGGVSERFVPNAGPGPGPSTSTSTSVGPSPGAGPDDAAVAVSLGLRRPYVLTIATADPRKNLSALAPAAAALNARGIDLVWAGDARPYFTAAAVASGVRSLGYVDDRQLPALYRGALAFVLPSRYEGFGLTCLEAMACGTPVVAANRAALPETCGDAALLVDPDTAELTEAVVAAATHAPTRQRLRAAGLRRARNYTWARAAASTDALLQKLAERP